MKSALAATLWMLASVCVRAQEVRGAISGTVFDPSGATVPGTRVVARNTESGVVTESQTNAGGLYSVPFLIPGTYTLTFEKRGFEQYVRQDIALHTSERLAIDAALVLGAFSDRTTTTGIIPELQTNTATRQTTTENLVLENVPSGGRNLFALQYDQPGVVKTSAYWGAMELYAFGNVNAVSIGGGRSGENETILDGLTDSKSDRGVAFVPSVAAVQEFTVQTNFYDAQFGRLGGGATLITLKSGANSFHGQLYEYFKNDKLRANDWVANKNGNTRTPFKNNTYGLEVDGPIRIPRVWDGRNRMFFTLSFEGLREHDPGGTVTTLPTPVMLKGDFSHLVSSSGNPIVIYDPLSTRLAADGVTFIRTPFPGNVIPPDRINPIAAKVAAFYPAPNLPGISGLNNYQKILPQTNGYDFWLGKLDYVASAKSRFWFRYGENPWVNHAGLVWGTNPAEPSNQYPQTRVPRDWGADWTYILTPFAFFNLRGGLARYEAFSGNGFGSNYDPRQLGFPGSLVSQFTALLFPRFNIGSYSPIGAQGVSSYLTQDAWSVSPSLSLVKNRHNVMLGAELRRYNDNSLNPGLASGSYTFTPAWTQANPQRADSASGDAFASFLLGYPSGGFVDRNIDTAYSADYYALYAQDEVKLNSRVTLNVGLRWDYESPRRERYDRMVRGFAFGQASPIARAVQTSPAAASCAACEAGLRGGLLYAGPEGGVRDAFLRHKLNLQPRAGVAWRVTNRIVFRAGYGLSNLGQSSNGPPTGFSRQTPIIASLDNNLTPAVSLRDPFPLSSYPNGLLQPIGNTAGLSTNLGQNLTFQYLDRPLPRAQQYSGGFQISLPFGWLIEASYAGNMTGRLPVTLPINFISRSTLESIPVNQRQSYFNQQVANPMAGLLPNSALNGATVARQQLLYAFPQYGAASQMTDVPIGSQRNDSLQLKASHRLAFGLALTAAFTASKTFEQISVLNAQDVDLQDPRRTPLEKRLVQFDVPQQFSVIGTYDVPYGSHRRFGGDANHWLKGILGGWTVSGVWMSHSGFPLPYPNAAPLRSGSAALSDAQRNALAQATGRAQYDPSIDVWFDTSMFPRVAQAPFTLRTFPTRFSDVRSRPLNVTDLSLAKQFQMGEKLRWQIRCDAHNAANFPWFASLDSNGADVASPLFGHLKADIGNETRVIVGVLKVVF